MKVLSVSVTAAGRELSARLPWDAVHGSLAETVRARFGEVDGWVLFVATGVAVRVVGPLLRDKLTDPAVVCVDEAGRWVVALCGGHAAGANDLAREVAALLGATAVVTTATDSAGILAVDQLSGFVATGDLTAVSRARLDGEPVTVDNPMAWPLPPSLSDQAAARGAGGGRADGRARVVITDRSLAPSTPEAPTDEDVVLLHPPSLVLGVGTSSAAPADDLAMLAATALADAGLASASVAAVATLDRKRHEPAIVLLAMSLGVPIVDFTPDALADVEVPTPSAVVAAAVGTPSVAEAAALLAAGPGAALVVTKRRSRTATVAIARRRQPVGHLWVVGLGPGAAEHRTPAATAAIRNAEVVIGYGPYLDLAADAISAGATVAPSPIGSEVQRAALALSEAAAGRRVALVCSGDAGVYALATLVFELAADCPVLDPTTDITVVPGVTAALASSAALGAPLGHDHVAISLSDLLTPWPVIQARLQAAADADLVVSLYNPRSAGRDWQLAAARDLLAARRPATTPVGIVTDAGRAGERVEVTTIAELDPSRVGMTTCVIVGASSTRVIRGRMVTPRGYATAEPTAEPTSDTVGDIR